MNICEKINRVITPPQCIEDSCSRWQSCPRNPRDDDRIQGLVGNRDITLGSSEGSDSTEFAEDNHENLVFAEYNDEKYVNS